MSPVCDNEPYHLYGLGALRVIDDRAEPRPGTIPVQRCDLCAVFDGDIAAADAVALMRGGRVVKAFDQQGNFLQAFVEEVR